MVPLRQRVKGKIISCKGEIIPLLGVSELAEWGQSCWQGTPQRAGPSLLNSNHIHYATTAHS